MENEAENAQQLPSRKRNRCAKGIKPTRTPQQPPKMVDIGKASYKRKMVSFCKSLLEVANLEAQLLDQHRNFTIIVNNDEAKETTSPEE